MESFGNFIHLITTVEGISEIIRFGGLMLLILIVFAETGLLVGFFLPGDSLLVAAGFLAATTDILDTWSVVITLSVAAIIGDSTGYYIGKKAGASEEARARTGGGRSSHIRARYMRTVPVCAHTQA